MCAWVRMVEKNEGERERARERGREREGERVWEREKGWDRKRIKPLASTNNFNSI